MAKALKELYPQPCRLTLEIGCGHGHWLVDFATDHPEKECLGVDLIRDRIERAERKRVRAGVGNAHFLKAEAFELLDQLPDQVALAEVFVLFPDPWPKKRHWKNRLFCHGFLEELAKRCEVGTRCHFRTDHEGYFEWAEEIISEQARWGGVEEAEWPFEKETVFQARAEAFQSLIIEKR